MNGLNVQQEDAVLNSFDKDTLLVAAAGSGKTRVITFRVKNLIETYKVDPKNIMMVTFTNKAAGEMRDRLENLGVDTKDIYLGTFHSICLRLLKMYGKEIGLTSFNILDTTDTRNIMTEVLQDLLIPDDKETVKKYLSKVSSNKNNFIKPVDAINKASDEKERLDGMVYKHYQDKCWEKKMLDFDDLLVYTVVLLNTSIKVRNYLSNSFKYILVDEFQDTNKTQALILKLLKNATNNLFCVGDDGQSVYGFRNANPQYTINFTKAFVGSKVMFLEQNYRSTQTIIEASNDVIKNNKDQIQKKVFSTNEIGEKVKYRECASNSEEGLYVASEINYLVNKGKYNYKDFAVLYRTNSQSRAVEDALLALKIPYNLVGGLSFYSRKEIKDVMAYLRLKSNPYDEIAFKRILKTFKGIGDKTVSDLIAVAKAYNLDLITLLDVVTEPKKILPNVRYISSIYSSAISDSPFDFMEHVVQQTHVLENFDREGTPEALARKENVLELLTIAKENDYMTLTEFTDHVALSSKDDGKKNPDAVTLMTIHSSKGLEYTGIFVVGVEENILPHANSKGNSKSLEEERRLMYVAMTRAKKLLFLTNAEKRKEYNKETHNPVSRFIREINKKHIEEIL